MADKKKTERKEPKKLTEKERREAVSETFKGRGWPRPGAVKVERGVALAALALLLWGCAPKIEVSSDTSWSGVVNGASVEGTGSTTYKAHGCAVFQKATESGTLKVRAKHWVGADGWTETQAAYGVVEVCP